MQINLLESANVCDNNFKDSSILLTDLDENRDGPKESDNKDKSLHGLVVALAMAGVIAGSVILFAYASSDNPVPAGTASTTNQVELQTEPKPVIVEKVVDDEPADEPEHVEKTETAGEGELIYVNTTTEVKEVVSHTEEEVEEQETGDEPASLESDEQEEKDDDLQDEPESDDMIAKRVLDLIDDAVDFEDDEDEKEDKDDNGNKGKGHKHDEDDD